MPKSKNYKIAKPSKIVKVEVKKIPAVSKIAQSVKKSVPSVVAKKDKTKSVVSLIFNHKSKTKEGYITFWQYVGWFSGILIVVMLVGTIVVVNKTTNKVVRFNNFALPTNQNNIEEQNTFNSFISSLTGEAVTQEVVERRPLAIMIENFYTVRPQSGLSFADIVWEAPTEGGVTRFLAIFQKGLPSRIGPVRSARSYFIDWAREFDAFYAHSGGSSDALDELARGIRGLQDVNEFFHERAFWRDSKEARPHNLYAAAELFYNYAAINDWRTTSTLDPRQFTDVNNLSASLDNPEAKEILIPYFPLEYDVLWKYQASDGVYERWMDNKPHQDRITGGTLQAKNVIIIFTNVIPIPKDPLLKVNIKTVGEGTAYLFVNGKAYQGKWQKRTLESRTEFLDDEGNYLPLAPGNTWISVLDKSLAKELEYK